MNLGSLFKATVGIATLPIDVVKDVFTFGGIATEQEPYTKQKIEEIADDLDEVTKD